MANGPGPGYRELLRVLGDTPEVTDSYEGLLTRLCLLGRDRPVKRVLVTSTQPQEGKTTVAVNLALTMGLAGRKTLLMDADLRKPQLHRIFDLRGDRGFTDFVSGALGPHDVVHTITLGTGDAGAIRALDVMTSGNGSPRTIQTLSLPRLRETLGSIDDRYDTVLLDSPPVLAVSDALLLAPVVDGVLLVMNAGMVERAVKRAVQALTDAGARMLGVVMNRFDETVHGPGSHPYAAGYYRDARRDRLPLRAPAGHPGG